MVSPVPSGRSLPSWRNVAGLLAGFVRIDVRRPASWITLASGVGLGWCSTRPSSNDFALMVSAASLVVAAIGDLPLAVCRPAGRGLACGWACERSSWPMAGVMLGIVAARGGLPPFSIDGLPPVVVGGGFATVTSVVCRLFAIRVADSASVTLLMAAASAAGGAWVASRSGPGLLGSAVVWLLLGCVCRRWSWSPAAAIDVAAIEASRDAFGDGAGGLRTDAFPAGGAVRHALVRLSMVAGLVAMAMWLVSDPQGEAGAVGPGGRADTMAMAVAWGLFMAGWFVGLAVPQATLQDGVAGVGAWDLLFRTAAGPGRGGRSSTWPLRVMQPGAVRFALGVIISQAAILGWPVVVSMVLSLSTPAKAAVSLGVAVGLAGSAVALTAVVASGAVVRASRETTFAVAIAIVAACLAFAAVRTPSGPPPARRILPGPPGLSDLSGFASPPTARRRVAHGGRHMEERAPGGAISLRDVAFWVEEACPEER